MSCCGTRYKVKKDIIHSQIKQQLQKVEVKQDDTIRIPPQDRKLFRCNFNISQIIKPQHLIIATVDYTHINTDKRYEQQFSNHLSQMVRQQPHNRQDEVKFQLHQKQIIKSKDEIIQNDSGQRQIGEQEISLKVIDQYQKDTEKEKGKDLQKEREMVIA